MKTCLGPLLLCLGLVTGCSTPTTSKSSQENAETKEVKLVRVTPTGTWIGQLVSESEAKVTEERTRADRRAFEHLLRQGSRSNIARREEAPRSRADIFQLRLRLCLELAPA